MRLVVSTCGGHRLQSPRQEAEGKEDLEKTLRLQGSVNHSIKNECEELELASLRESTAGEPLRNCNGGSWL